MKKFIAMLFVVCIVFSLCACGSSGGSGESLTFATGGESGTYYAFGSVLAQYVSNNTDIKITAVVGNGSQANVEDLDSGAVQLGFCQSDVMSYAYSGTNLFAESGAVDSFSVAAALYMEQVQIVTTNPDIKTVEDLKGKTVSIGALGSGVYFNAVDVLGVYGIDAEKDITPVYQSFGDSAESLKDGKIDAAFIVAGAPTTAITDLATASSVYLVSIDDEHMDTLPPPTTRAAPSPLTPTALPTTSRPSPLQQSSSSATMSPRMRSTSSFPPSLKTPAASSTARPRS